MTEEETLIQKIQDLEDKIQYQEAVIEEIYSAHQSLFPVFADLVRLISRMYEEIDIKDKEVKRCITRLQDIFFEREAILEKYRLEDDQGSGDSGVAYT